MKKLFTTLSVFMLSLVGCVDRDFNLAETSGELTIGGDELILPLGDIGNISIDELLKESKNLKKDEDGLYQISFSSFGDDPTKFEKISINGITIDPIHCELPQLEPIKFSSIGELPNSFRMSGINNSFAVDIPTISGVMDVVPIKTEKSIPFKNLPFSSGKGTINSALLAVLQQQNLSSLSTSDQQEIVFDAELNILKQLDEVRWVEFGCDEHPLGAPFEAKLALNGLADINGGGSLKLRIEFPDGYHILNSKGGHFADENIYEEVFTISPKQTEVNALVYLQKIDYEGRKFTDGVLKIDDHIRYSYELSMDLGTGNYDLNNSPSFLFESEPKYKDVEIKLGAFNAPNDGDTISCDINYVFNGLPAGINISKVAFSEAPLTIKLEGLEWIKIKCEDTGNFFSPEIEIVLPECMNFKPNRLLVDGNKLIATTMELYEGITLDIDHINCNAEGISQNNGQLSIDSKLQASVHLEGLTNHVIHISSLVPPATFKGVASLSVSETKLVIDAANSDFSITDEQSFPLDLGDQIPTISQSIEIPEMIASIERINIGKAGGKGEPVSMTFSLRKASTFPVEALDIEASVNLGKLLKPTDDMLAENGGPISKDINDDYIFSINETWEPTKSSLTKVLKFEALENLPKIENGKIQLNQSFPVTGSAKIKSGNKFDLTQDAEINIDIAIDDIEILTFSGCLDISVKPETMNVDLGDMKDLDINIKSLSLNPVIDILLADNPTGVSLSADILINTLDANNNILKEIRIPKISINESGASHIVVSTPINANKYKGDDVIFVETSNLSDLFAKGIPSKIMVDMEVYSDKNKVVTIDLSNTNKGYNIEYQYQVVVPLQFDGNIDISYETSVMGLNETFSTLANEAKGISVGDISIIGVFGSTIPLDVVISAELVDKEGNNEGIGARLNIINCLIKGAGPNGEKHNSEVEFEFELDKNGSLEGLRNADGIHLKLSVSNSDANDIAEINKSQYIDGKLELRIRNGLTIDIFELSNKEE